MLIRYDTNIRRRVTVVFVAISEHQFEGIKASSSRPSGSSCIKAEV